MRIELERWQAAQTEEFSHHQDLRIEAYITATNVIAKYFGIDYKKDFKDKVIYGKIYHITWKKLDYKYLYKAKVEKRNKKCLKKMAP